MKVRLISGYAPRADDEDRVRVMNELGPLVNAYLIEERPDLVIVGDAFGVDMRAVDFCRAFSVDVHVSCAHWRGKHKRGAGHRRNLAMAKSGAAHRFAGDDVQLAAFPGPRSVGTWNMVSVCAELQIPLETFGPWKERR